MFIQTIQCSLTNIVSYKKRCWYIIMMKRCRRGDAFSRIVLVLGSRAALGCISPEALGSTVS